LCLRGTGRASLSSAASSAGPSPALIFVLVGRRKCHRRYNVGGRLTGRGGRAQWPRSPSLVFLNQSYAHVFRHARFSRARARQASTVPCYITLLHVSLQSSGTTAAPYFDSVSNFLRTLQDNIIIVYLHAKPTERCAYTQYSFYNIVFCTLTNNTRRKTIF